MKKAKSGAITFDQAKEIAVMSKTASLSHFKPLMYVIPHSLVSGRVQRVPLKNAASFEPEYTVSDLTRSEFHVIEL
jgi:energy-coupling factor transporter ATP-binding protein EcfA2